MPTLRSGQFELTASDYPGVSLVGYTRGIYESQNGAVCTYTDGYIAGFAAGTIGMSPFPGFAEVVTTGDGTFDIESAPPGFTPTTNLRAYFARHLQLSLGESVTFNIPGVNSVTINGPVTDSNTTNTEVPIPDGRTWFLLKTDLYQWIKSATGFPIADVPYVPNTVIQVNPGCIGIPVVQLPALKINGDYVIIAWWWVIPDKSDPCQEDQVSRLQLSSDQPADSPEGFVYQKLDPNDPDAAPTPVITSIEPNHGSINGASIMIHGSGFGEGATVDVDGAPATSVVVVSQYKITCLAPAHARGPVTVTVTNVDGGHS